MRFYSPSTGGFYSTGVHGAREIEQPLTTRETKAGKRPELAPNPACTIPDDAVPITDQRHAELLAAQADPAAGAGKEIVAIGGKPMARERVADPAERLAARRRERDRLLAASDWTQLGDAQAPGGAKAWAAYRQNLRDLDMTTSDWPDRPGSTS